MDIDYVVAWVNGQESAHAHARRLFPPDDAIRGNEEAVGDVRFFESGEIYYNIASVLKYAPFVRRIVLVTDGQKPEFLEQFFNENKCSRDFIKIVSHDEIFEGLDAIRPNFSSLSIEAALWRIPDLSEHFIYANDDFFFNSKVSERDFFHAGVPVLRGTWSRPERDRVKNVLRSALRKLTGRGPNINPTFRKSLDSGAVVAGSRNGFLAIGHHPHPLRRSTFDRFFSRNGSLLNAQVSHRYRSIEQFNPVSMANQLEILNHKARIHRPATIAYIDPRKKKDIEHEAKSLSDTSVLFGCIQGMESMPDAQAKWLHGILVRKFEDFLPSGIRYSLGGSSSSLSQRAAAKPTGYKVQLSPNRF